MIVIVAECFFCDHRTGLLSVLLSMVMIPESCGFVGSDKCGAPVDVKTICHASVLDYAFYHFKVVIFYCPCCVGPGYDIIYNV